MASSSWCLSAAAAAALQNITKQATTLTGAQWGQSILEGIYTHILTTLHVIQQFLFVFTEQKLKQKDIFEIFRVIFMKWFECDFIQVLNPWCTVLSNSACSLLFIRSIRDFRGTSSHLQAGILS